MARSSEAIRVLIADDHAVVREGLATVIGTQADMRLIGQASDGTEAVALSLALDPDVILMDLVMPNKNGLQAIREIMVEQPAARILVLTSFADDTRVFPAIKAGALGYLLKDATHDQLFQAIRSVARGEVSLAPEIAVKVMREFSRGPQARPVNGVAEEAMVDELTPRELQTLKLVAQGLRNREIADVLVLHERTVAKYVGSILSKLHLANRTQAALYAIREGLSELP
jgi:NarL family two-component system response regulator LiaR